jgi:hypothetical protein
MSDLLDGQPEIVVPLDDHVHIQRMWVMFGVVEAVDILTKLAEQHKLPGIKFAIATLDAEAQRKRCGVLSKNIRLAAKAGVDLDRYDLAIAADKTGTRLVCTRSPDAED